MQEPLKTHVVVADEQPDIRKLVSMTLECYPHLAVLEAHDGGGAWLHLQRYKPALAVLDVMMPVIDGLQLCRMIRQSPELHHTRVVMLSARAQRQDIQNGIQSGCDVYLTKPFSPSHLLDTVDMLLGHQPLPHSAPQYDARQQR